VEPLNEIARQINDPMPAAIVHYVRLWPLLNVAELEQASGAAEGMIAFYDPEKHGNIAYLYGYDFGALAYGFGSWVQWMLGYPDRALKWLDESILIARKLNHPFTLAFSLLCGCELHWFLRDLQMVNRYTEELVPLSAEKGFVYWEGHGIFYRGERKTLEGQIQQGIAEMRQGLAIMRGTGTETCLTRLLARIADACMKMGQLDEGLAAIEEAMGFVQKFDERYVEAELHRLKGELFLLQGKDETDAESCFVRAIEVSRRQKAKSWELRTAMSLSRLRLRQGRREEGRQLLGEAYHWFTEGLETADLREARALLEKMNS
jgi:predicted ATPase